MKKVTLFASDGSIIREWLNVLSVVPEGAFIKLTTNAPYNVTIISGTIIVEEDTE